MSTFTLPDNQLDNQPDCQVNLPNDLTQGQLLAFRPFLNWISTLKKSIAAQLDPKHPFHAKPYKLRRIHVQAVDWFGDRIGFIKLRVEMTNDDGGWLPGAVFMRGPSVAMLVILSSMLSDFSATNSLRLWFSPMTVYQSMKSMLSPQCSPEWLLVLYPLSRSLRECWTTVLLPVPLQGKSRKSVVLRFLSPSW
jgi:hypothetical protein